MRALLHAHSTYSYDGGSSLQELSVWGASRGLDFILLTEHVNDFDASKMARYVREVDALDETACRLIPGLEFAVRGGFHVLGFHLRRWRRAAEPFEVVEFIRQNGGLAVLAHPSRYRGRWPDEKTLRSLHGIEVWNARYDGRFLPSGELLKRSKSIGDHFGLRFFGGQDLHLVSNHRLVVTTVQGPPATDGLLGALAQGRASFGAPGLRFDARSGNGHVSPALLKLGHRSYRWAKGLRDRFAG